jgi:hypothetical protein
MPLARDDHRIPGRGLGDGGPSGVQSRPQFRPVSTWENVPETTVQLV